MLKLFAVNRDGDGIYVRVLTDAPPERATMVPSKRLSSELLLPVLLCKKA